MPLLMRCSLVSFSCLYLTKEPKKGVKNPQYMDIKVMVNGLIIYHTVFLENVLIVQ